MDLARFKKVLEDGGLEYVDHTGKKQTMKPQSERSVYNKREVVTFLLKEYKVTRADGKPILRSTDRIKPRSDKHKAYTREEVEAILPVTREQRQCWAYEAQMSTSAFSQPKKAFCCPDFRVRTLALCLDLPATIRRLPN